MELVECLCGKRHRYGSVLHYSHVVKGRGVRKVWSDLFQNDREAWHVALRLRTSGPMVLTGQLPKP